jgi:hypothetical protein
MSIRWTGHVAHRGDMRNTVLFRKPQKRCFGRQRHRWKYDSIMDLREMGFEGMEWIQVA